MMRYVILIPCDVCTHVPAIHVARCGLLVCRKCWHEERMLCEEVEERLYVQNTSPQ